MQYMIVCDTCNSLRIMFDGFLSMLSKMSADDKDKELNIRIFKKSTRWTVQVNDVTIFFVTEYYYCRQYMFGYRGEILSEHGLKKYLDKDIERSRL